MTLNLLALLLTTLAGAEPSGFDAPDPAARLEAARRHQASNPPLVDARSWGKRECRWFSAPSGSSCTARVQLCRGESSSGLCDGSFHEWQWAYPAYAGEPEPTWVNGTGMGQGLPLREASGLDESGVEMEAYSQCRTGGFGCVGTPVPGGASEEERQKLKEEDRKRCDEAAQAHKKRLERCEARVRLEARKRSSSMRCELIAVQPCFNEAYVRCEAKRMKPEGIPLDEVFRVSWKRGKKVRARETLQIERAKQP